jgi:hypothetical protein
MNLASPAGCTTAITTTTLMGCTDQETRSPTELLSLYET